MSADFIDFGLPRRPASAELIPNFDFRSDYTFYDFENQFRERHFNSIQDADTVLSKIYPKVIAPGKIGYGRYVKKQNDGFFYTSKLSGVNFDMWCRNKRGKETKLSFMSYLNKKPEFAKHNITATIGKIRKGKRLQIV